MRVSLIVAMGENGVIGQDGGLPWRIPADLKHFRATTMGKPIIMGRRTYESIGRALPGRTNIVITRQPDFEAEDVDVTGSLDAALRVAGDAAGDATGEEGEAIVIGGAEIYRAALPRAGRIYLTEVAGEQAGDVFFPRFDRGEWREIARQDFPAICNTPAYSFVTLERQ